MSQSYNCIDMTHGRTSSGNRPAFILGFFAGAATVVLTKIILVRSHTTRTGMRIESWVLRAKAEILRRLADAEDMTEREYSILVDLVTLRYGHLQNISRDKIAEVAAELKARWRDLKEEARKRKQEFANLTDTDDTEY